MKNIIRMAFAAWAVLTASHIFNPARADNEPTEEQIKRGEYLARMGDCVSCHSSPEGGNFGGGLRINTPFGYLISPNISFDRTTGIGDLVQGRLLERATQRREEKRRVPLPSDAVHILHQGDQGGC